MAKKQIKKVWVSIRAPKIFKEIEIGEIPTYDPQSIIGKQLWTYYTQLSGDVTKHYVKIKLRINSVKGENAYTEISQYEITRPYLARAIRRRKSKVDFVKDVKCKDKKIRIKWVILTSSKANASQRRDIRKKLDELIEKEIPKYSLDNLILDIANKKIQKEFGSEIRKVFPISFIEVRKVEVKSSD